MKKTNTFEWKYRNMELYYVLSWHRSILSSWPVLHGKFNQKQTLRRRFKHLNLTQASIRAQIQVVQVYFNTYHAADKSRRQVQNVAKFCPKCRKILKMLEFHYHIWNHHEKCIQISTNMPGIGSLICEIHVKITEIWEAKWTFAQ